MGIYPKLGIPLRGPWGIYYKEECVLAVETTIHLDHLDDAYSSCSLFSEGLRSHVEGFPHGSAKVRAILLTMSSRAEP